MSPPPSFEVAELTYAQLVAAKDELSATDLIARLRDGRGVVRVNALLGLAAIGHPGPEVVLFLRDADARVARAAAEALVQLGTVQRGNLSAIAATLGEARAEVFDAVARMFAGLIGHADAELISVLDTARTAAADAVISACARTEFLGLQLLQAAARDPRPLVRLNAVRGISVLGVLEQPSSFEVLQLVERSDDISDVRAATRKAIAVLKVSCINAESTRRKTADPAPVPALEQRVMTEAELKAAAATAPRDELLRLLASSASHARLNAVRLIALKGVAGLEIVNSLVGLLRDTETSVRLEVAQVLAKLGANATVAVPALVSALEDRDPTVVTAAEAALVGMGDAAGSALLDELDTPRESLGARVALLVGRLAQGPQLLRDALSFTSVDARIHAALALAALGNPRARAALPALTAIPTTGNARLRAAVGKALAAIEPRPDRAPLEIAIEGFHTRRLTESELGAGKAALAAVGVGGLVAHLNDPRVAVRENVVVALGSTGSAAAGALAVALRDVDAAVRLKAAQLLGRLGASATVAVPALVVALEDPDAAVVAAAETAVSAMGDAAGAALLDALDTPSEALGARVGSLISRLEASAQLFSAALFFTSLDARIHAANALAALGAPKARVAISALGASSTSSNARLRAAVARAIAAIEPRPDRGPPAIVVDGFATRVLTEAELATGKPAFAGVGVAGLAAHLNDPRVAVRTNVAVALGAFAADAVVAAGALAVALRDAASEVRIAAARSLERLGDAAIEAVVDDLVRALRDDGLTTQVASVLRSRTSPGVDAALARGLDTTDAAQAHRILELLIARPAGLDLLCAAFARTPSQANAARGLAMLGKDRVGKGRAVLEAARADLTAQTRELASATLRAIDGPVLGPTPPAVAGFETTLLEETAFGKGLTVSQVLPFLLDGRPVVRANAATALGTLAGSAEYAVTIGALLRDDDPRVRVAAASALDKLGDDVVIATAPNLVDALRGDASVHAACKAVIAERGAKLEAALVAGLETGDETHGMRIAELICALPNAPQLLFAAFDGEAQNVQINAAFGIGLLGAKRAGAAGRARLRNALAGPPTRRRHAIVKALALLGPE